MRLLILTTSAFAISFSCLSQVNRYTAPPNVAQYNPMTFDELLFAPKVKSQKSDENFQKLKSLHTKILAYIEVNKDDFDEIFNNEMVSLATKFDEIVKGDLSSKEYEIQKLEFGFEKIKRDFEKRPKNLNQIESSRSSPLISKNNVESNSPTKVELGVPVYSMPKLKRDYPESVILGYTKRYNYVLLEKFNEEFYKIRLNGELGYISTTWVNKDWRN
jgi:hypothetical protein